jgi:competence protein ComFC
MAAINPQKITGTWMAGVALDIHTISSTYLGVNEFGHDIYDSVRSELGALLLRLKYRADRSAAQEIIDTAAGYLRQRLKDGIRKFDVIIPVPPSATRALQPVLLLANGIGEALGVPVDNCITPMRPTAQLKDVSDPAKRKEMLDGLYHVDPIHTENKNILLFDDLFRSGATMNAITGVLLGQGKAASVRAFTITRTRKNL